MIKNIALGVDIGGTNSTFGIVDEAGDILYRGNLATQGTHTIEEFVGNIAKETHGGLSQLGTGYTLKGIGIGAPNGNYYTGNIEYAPNLPWQGVVELTSVVQEVFQSTNVYISNDANASAIGEMLYGAAKGLRNFLVITLGTGVGSGIVCNGELIYGANAFAGELGHMIIEPNGRSCGCGRKGCLETYASATGIVRTAMRLLENDSRPSCLREIKKIEAKDLSIAAIKGDLLALEIFEETARKLGLGLANAVTATDPEAIIIQGGLSQAGDLLLKPTRKYLEENLLNIYRDRIKLRTSGLKENDAAILGAAALVWQEINRS